MKFHYSCLYILVVAAGFRDTKLWSFLYSGGDSGLSPQLGDTVDAAVGMEGPGYHSGSEISNSFNMKQEGQQATAYLKRLDDVFTEYHYYMSSAMFQTQVLDMKGNQINILGMFERVKSSSSLDKTLIGDIQRELGSYAVEVDTFQTLNNDGRAYVLYFLVSKIGIEILTSYQPLVRQNQPLFDYITYVLDLLRKGQQTK